MTDSRRLGFGVSAFLTPGTPCPQQRRIGNPMKSMHMSNVFNRIQTSPMLQNVTTVPNPVVVLSISFET